MTSQTPGPIVALPLTALVQTALNAAEQLPTKAAEVPAVGPLRRTAVVGEVAARGATNAVGTAELLCVHPTPDVVKDLHDMHVAFARQLWAIDQEWRAGLMRLFEGAQALHTANTLSRIIEQDLNLVGQYGDMLKTYATSTAALIENTSVGYSFWLSRKVSEMQAAKAAP